MKDKSKATACNVRKNLVNRDIAFAYQQVLIKDEIFKDATKQPHKRQLSSGFFTSCIYSRICLTEMIEK